MDRVVLISRAGRDTLSAATLARLEATSALTVHVRHDAPGPAEAARLLADATVLAATNVCLPQLDRRLLDACPALRAVVLYATGYEHVDRALLGSHSIDLRTLPTYATGAVAEHALGLMLGLATRLTLANDRCRGLTPRDVSLRGVELAGRTLGIVGTGRIGARLGVLARGIGMEVVGVDPDPAARRRATAMGVRPVTRAELFGESSVVALCASTQAGRPPLVGAEELTAMRHGSFLVNIGRPQLVDTDAAVAALRSGRLRGYAVDEVVARDRGDMADVVAEGRLVQSAHSAWWRDEVLVRGAQAFGETVLDVVGTAHPRDEPAMLAGESEEMAR